MYIEYIVFLYFYEMNFHIINEFWKIFCFNKFQSYNWMPWEVPLFKIHSSGPRSYYLLLIRYQIKEHIHILISSRIKRVR